MTSEERCYKILQDSNYIRVPEHETKIQNFLDQIKECAFEFPETDIEKRQFETILKTWFDQYTAELIEFAKENPYTFKNREAELDFVNFHTMDDQGFNGQVMENGYFLRNFQDTIDTQKNLKCDFADSDDSVLTCTEQAKMFQLGYIMDYNYEWIKDPDTKIEYQACSVDWVHVHNGENCAKVKAFYEGVLMTSVDAEKRRIYKDKSDSDLESMWQAQANMIQMALSKAYDDETDKTESDRCHELAKTAQEKQSLIQDEITKRSKL